MRTRTCYVPFTIACLYVALLAPGVPAQPMLINPALAGAPTEKAPAPAAPSAAAKRAENAEQLRIAMRKLDANGASDTSTAQEVAFYQTRDAVLTQQDAVEQQVKDLESRKAELEAQLKAPPALDKQYKFADLDRLKDDVASEQARATLLADKLTAAKASLQKAKNTLDESDVKRRQSQGDFEANRNATNSSDLAVAADRARQAAVLASETFTLRKRELEREELAREVLNLSIRVKQEQVKRVSPLVAFTEADYREQIENLKKSEDSATSSLAQAQANLHHSDIDLGNTQQQIDSGAGDRAILTEVLAAHRRARDKYSEEIDSLTQRLQQFAQLRTAWSRRYEIATADPEKTDDEVWARLKTVQKETKAVLDELAAGLRAQIMKMRETRSQLTSVTKKVEAAANGPPEIAVQLGIQQKRLEETLRLYEKNMVTIETSRRVHEKLLDEVGQTVEVLSPKAIALGAWYQAQTVWNTELFGTKDQSITIGKAITCVTIFIFGWLLSRFTSGVFANRLLKRFRLSKDATSAIRSLVFYCMLLLVGVSALRSINVDLTAFTILGGALAIGVGFGSQTLINNFIGGLIMLAERPVRLGERITFKDMDGIVEDVGFRCTKLRTQTDHLVTIPNSTLVNESIENIDRRRTIRRSFTLAITYNISRDRLADGIQAVREVLEERGIREKIHPIVGFEELSPRVHFSEFGVESLNIQVTYWFAPVDSTAFHEHCERVNFRIMEEFERLGIDFAFPSKTAYVKNAKSAAVSRTRANDSFAA